MIGDIRWGFSVQWFFTHYAHFLFHSVSLQGKVLKPFKSQAKLAPYEEMELSRGTGQSLIVRLVGRGTPLAITLTSYGLCVKDSMA